MEGANSVIQYLPSKILQRISIFGFQISIFQFPPYP